MADDLIRYDLLVQDALRGVVRKVLTDAARDGLMGDHHFYVSFRTEAPGVRMSQALREKYPQDMTIVLQHQFWDLSVNEHTFEVGLSFSGVPERLLVPFDALSGFFDPSVQFGLKFDLTEAGEVPEEANAAPAKTGPRGPAPSRARSGRRAPARHDRLGRSEGPAGAGRPGRQARREAGREGPPPRRQEGRRGGQRRGREPGRVPEEELNAPGRNVGPGIHRWTRPSRRRHVGGGARASRETLQRRCEARRDVLQRHGHSRDRNSVQHPADVFTNDGRAFRSRPSSDI